MLNTFSSKVTSIGKVEKVVISLKVREIRRVLQTTLKVRGLPKQISYPKNYDVDQ